jgi:hypothetical protein
MDEQLELFSFDYSENKWRYLNTTPEQYAKWDQIVELELMMGENNDS